MRVSGRANITDPLATGRYIAKRLPRAYTWQVWDTVNRVFVGKTYRALHPCNKSADRRNTDARRAGVAYREKHDG